MKLPIPPKEHLFFPWQKRSEWLGEVVGRIIKKFTKLNLGGYWLHVLINSTISTVFEFLVSVLLCHNLASSMVKYEDSLT